MDMCIARPHGEAARKKASYTCLDLSLALSLMSSLSVRLLCMVD